MRRSGRAPSRAKIGGSAISSATRLAAPAIAVAAAIGTVFAFLAPEGKAPPPPTVAAGGGYVGSASCRACHEDRHASWERTFHRTMTQTPDAAVGRFDGRRVPYAGGAARPIRDGDRIFVLLEPDVGRSRRAEVALLSGSHRYQQLFERVERAEGAAYVRLPIVWSVVDDRWLPITAIFLDPDGVEPSAHATDWNSNCVFCHATGPRPGLLGLDADFQPGVSGYETTVAELGVACEACHGPGAAHVAAMAYPAERAAAEAAGSAPGVVSPADLSPALSADVCAQCHGQRLPEPPARAATWIREGPTFRPGEPLESHATLVTRDTPAPKGADPAIFERRFWSEGTPRLTAYEAQGLFASACFDKGGATCSTCHAMHAGDPDRQLRPGAEGDAACATCHAPATYATKAHTGHEEGGPGSSCVACHMPRIVFGVLDARRSHKIDVPDVKRDVEAGRPNACALCHLDRSPTALAADASRLFGRPLALPSRRGDRAPLDAPDGFATAFAGDPVARFVAVRAFGDAPQGIGGAVTKRPVDAKAFEISRRAALAAAHGDAYPAIRIAARRAALALDPTPAPGFAAAFREIDPLAPADRRRRDISTLLLRLRRDSGSVYEEVFGADRLPPFGFDRDGVPDLRALADLAILTDDRPIRIGE